MHLLPTVLPVGCRCRLVAPDGSPLVLLLWAAVAVAVHLLDAPSTHQCHHLPALERPPAALATHQRHHPAAPRCPPAALVRQCRLRLVAPARSPAAPALQCHLHPVAHVRALAKQCHCWPVAMVQGTCTPQVAAASCKLGTPPAALANLLLAALATQFGCCPVAPVRPLTALAVRWCHCLLAPA